MNWKSVQCNYTKEATFSIRYAKLYVHVVTLSAQDNLKLLEELKSDFKITINWNKSSTSRNKALKCYDQRTKLLWSIGKK